MSSSQLYLCSSIPFTETKINNKSNSAQCLCPCLCVLCFCFFWLLWNYCKMCSLFISFTSISTDLHMKMTFTTITYRKDNPLLFLLLYTSLFCMWSTFNDVEWPLTSSSVLISFMSSALSRPTKIYVRFDSSTKIVMKIQKKKEHQSRSFFISFIKLCIKSRFVNRRAINKWNK